MELTRIIHTSVLDSPIPAKEIAKKIAKPYSTLLREINPYDEGAKLGVETLMDILKITNDASPLEYIAAELGLELVAKKNAQGRVHSHRAWPTLPFMESNTQP